MKLKKNLVKIIKSMPSSLKKIKEVDFYSVFHSPYLYLVLGLIIGFIFTVQFKTSYKRPLNPILFYGQIVDIKKDFSTKKEELDNEVKSLQKEIGDKESSLSDKNLVSNTLMNDIQEQELIFGSTPVIGGGVVITISDGVYQVKDESEKSLTHAADLRDIVNLLWYSGAEAISINDERLIYNTSIDCIVSTIMINNNNYAPPFTIKAIGNRQDLYGVLNNSRKLENIKKRASKKQINFEVKTETNVKVEKYSGIYTEL